MSAGEAVKNTPFDAAVTELQTKIEEMRITLDTLIRLQAEYGGSPSFGSRGGESEISHDTFFGMTIGDAAKKYLSIAKVTKSTSEISKVIENGGLKHSSKDLAATVRSVLGGREDFTRVPNGDWGLSEWYPGQGRGKKAAPDKKKKKKKAKKRAESKPDQTATPKPESKVEDAPKAEATMKPGPQSQVEAYLLKHPSATSREISDALGLRIQTVGLILGKRKGNVA